MLKRSIRLSHLQHPKKVMKMKNEAKENTVGSNQLDNFDSELIVTIKKVRA